MRINRIKLRNYRKFKYAEMEFGDGIISINGLNGAGKSSLVESIAWALYGNEKRILRDNKGGVKYSGAAASDSCSVELEFEIAGDNYLLVREMRGKNGTMVAEIKQNGIVQASSDADVRNFIEKTLGMDSEGFLISVFARQKELNALSDLTREARTRRIESMLGLDAIETARKHIGEDRRGVDGTLRGMNAVLYGDDGVPVISVKKKRLEEIKKDMELSEMELNARKKEHRNLIQRLRDADMRLKALQSLKESFSAVESELKAADEALEIRRSRISELEQEIEGIRKKISEMESLKSIPETLAEKEREREFMAEERNRAERLKSLEERRKELEMEIKKVRDAISSMEEDIADMRSQIPDRKPIENRLHSAKEEKKALEDRRNTIVSEKMSLEKQIEALEKAVLDIRGLGPESRCPTCHRQLGDDYGEIVAHMEEEKQSLVSAFREISGKLKATDSELERVIREIESLEKTLKDSDRMENSISNMESRKESRMERLSEYESELEKAEQEIEGLGKVSFDAEAYESLKNEIHHLREKERRFSALNAEVKREPELLKRLESAEKEIQALSERKKELEGRISDMGFDAKELSGAEQAYGALRDEERDMHAEISAMQTGLDSLKTEIKNLSDDIGRMEADMEKARKYEEDSRYLAKLESLMKDFRKEAISGIRPALEAKASEFFSSMTDGKYPGIELDGDYEIKIIDAGHSYSIKRFSGGESDLANLCLRLAISDVVVSAKGAMGFNFLVLDEIFGSQDTNRRENITKALQSLSSRFSQIFLISHIDVIKESASMVISVKETQSGESVLTLE